MVNLPNRKVRVLLCGYGHLGLALLQGLWACGEDCEIVGVFRWTARPGGAQFWEPVEAVFQQQVEQYGLRDIVCQGLNSYEFTALLKDLRPDVVLVGSWGEIIKQHLIENPDVILINCHPSKLPAHRGANPYASVILQQEQETGVTFHRMAAQIDAGAIFLQRSIPLMQDETGEAVRDKCALTAQDMVPELIARLKAHVNQVGALKEIEQDHSRQSYFPQLRAEDGALHWQDAPDVMYRQMRALFPWIACYGIVNKNVRVLFYDPNFMALLPEEQHQYPPGTVLSFNQGKLRIALSQQDRLLEVSKYQVALGDYGCPQWLSQIIIALLLRPGKRFASPKF